MRCVPVRGTAAISFDMVVVAFHNQHAGLQRALRQRGLVGSRVTGSAEEVVRHACNSDARGVVVEGALGASALRAIADAGDLRRDLAVVVVGPIEPALDVLVALASGVRGYLPAHAAPAAMADAVAAVVAGDIVAPRAVTAPLVQRLRTSSRRMTVSWRDGRAVELTAREWEVLVLLRQARSTEIARRLIVAPVTVRSHVAALVDKFGIAGRDELKQSSRS